MLHMDEPGKCYAELEEARRMLEVGEGEEWDCVWGFFLGVENVTKLHCDDGCISLWIC